MTASLRGMAIRLTAVLCVLASTSTAAQQFPRLQEDNLNGQQVVLPDAANGKIAVLVLGFSHASQNPTGAWMKRIQADYATNSGFVVYQLAVIEDAPKFIRGMITSGMKKGVAENQRPFFLPVVHNEADLKKLVGYKEEDDAYIVVLGRTGKVAYQTHGTPADAVYADFRVKVNSLLK